LGGDSIISKSNFIQLPKPSVVDSITGIVPYTKEELMERSDPDVFIVSSTNANTTAYGLPTRPAAGGSAAGLDRKSAYNAAVGEAVERYACCIIPYERLIYGSFIELINKGYQVVEPRRWALFHPSQYSHIPYEPFLDETQIAWITGDNLTLKQECLVPASLVYMPYQKYFLHHDEKVIGDAISTGTACATSREEALLKGICEVVERDAFVIMWRNCLSIPVVHIDENSPVFSLFNKKFSRPGLRYHLFYSTLDLSIPSFFGYLEDIRRTPTAICVGGAAHPDPVVGVTKTLLELVQGLKYYDYLKSKPLSVEPGFHNINSFEDRAHLYALNDLQKAFQFLHEPPFQIELSSIPSLNKDEQHTDLYHCVRSILNKELEIVAIDVTPIDVHECGLNVIKVIIPECQPLEGDHLLPFLGGYRWRDVPLKLGLTKTLPNFKTINRYPHPYP
jgi:ribosomal protein S12 methylthiotransferase accessory factor